jgi:hypothetical protein
VNLPTLLKNLVAWIGGGAALLTALVYGGKLVLEKWLQRREERQKAERQTELESHKAELVRLTEQLKHSLEREMLKAQLSTSKVHEVYPRLYARIVRAHGAVAGLLGGYEQTYQDYDLDDFDELLREKRLPRGERERLLERIKAGREDGIKELRRVLRRVRIHNARTQIGKAFNYHALKALYLSQPVGALALKILEAENRCWASMQNEWEAGLNSSNIVEDLQGALEKAEQLQLLMQKELQPGELQKI